MICTSADKHSSKKETLLRDGGSQEGPEGRPLRTPRRGDVTKGYHATVDTMDYYEVIILTGGMTKPKK